MNPSFAYFRPARHALAAALAAALVLAACASLPPPTAELDAARLAVARATDADADQYAAAAIAGARASLARAQEAAARGRDEEARSAALAASADADLAHAISRTSATRAELAQRQAQVAELRTRLQLDEQPPAAGPLDWPVPAASPEQRLQALEADARLNPFAAYERLQARQALAAAQAAGRRSRDAALELAERRVSIAEQAARIEAARRQLETLEREHGELRLEASRRDAERARAEAERLRLEAQVQAEEAARLRASVEQAEAVLDQAQVNQGERAAAARARELALARQEAELVAGTRLPPSRQQEDGEVFTLAGDAFGSGQASLTSAAQASVRALGAYLSAISTGSVQVLGHTDSQGDDAANLALSQRRAEAVRTVLLQAGVRGVSARGLGESQPVADNATAAGRARNRRVEVLVGNP